MPCCWWLLGQLVGLCCLSEQEAERTVLVEVQCDAEAAVNPHILA